MSEQKKINISIIIGILALAVLIFQSLYYTPYLLSCVGDEQYSLRSLANSFLSFVLVLTSGMTSSFIRFHKTNGPKQEGKTFSTFFIIQLIISAAVLLFGGVLLVLNHCGLILSREQYSQELIDAFSVILFISTLSSAVRIVLSLFEFYCDSNKHFILVRGINLLSNILYPTIAMIALYFGANMIIVTLIYSLVFIADSMFFVAVGLKDRRKNKKEYPDSTIKPSWPLAKEILIFSIFIVITAAGNTINFSIDNIILAMTLGGTAVTMYSLAYTLNQVIFRVSDLVYAPYIPSLAESFASGDKERATKIFRQGTRVMMLLTFTIVLTFAFCGKEFITAWVGEERVELYYYSLVMFAPWPLFATTLFSNSMAGAASKPKLPSLFFILSIVIHIALTLALLQPLGLWASFISSAVSMLFLTIAFYIFNHRVIKISQKGYFFDLLRFVVAGGAALGVSFIVSYFVGSNYPENLWLATIVKALIFLAFFAIFLAIVFYQKTIAIYKSIFTDQKFITENKEEIRKDCFITKLQKKWKFKKDKINKALCPVFIIYFLLTFANFLTADMPFASSFFESSLFEYATKGLAYLLLLGYLFVFIIANEIRMNKKLVGVFFFLIICSLIGTLLAPNEFFYTITEEERKITYQLSWSVGFIDALSYFGSRIIDLTMCFSVLFILRYYLSLNTIKVFMVGIIAIVSIECFYSLIMERGDYLNFLTTFELAENIHGTMTSKNSFGQLLFSGIIACTYFIFIHKNKWIWLPNVIFQLILLISRCQTAFICAAVLDVFVLVYAFIILFKKNKAAFYSVIGAASVLIVILAIFTAMPQITQNIPLIGNIFTKLNTLFNNFKASTLFSRFRIWQGVLTFLEAPYLFFGYGRGASGYLTAVVIFTTNTAAIPATSTHNTILDILVSDGIIGLVLYEIVAVYVLVRVITHTRDRKHLWLFIAVFVSSFVFGLTESTDFLVSSSGRLLTTTMLMGAFIGSSNYPTPYPKKKEITNNEKA